MKVYKLIKLMLHLPCVIFAYVIIIIIIDFNALFCIILTFFIIILSPFFITFCSHILPFFEGKWHGHNKMEQKKGQHLKRDYIRQKNRVPVNILDFLNTELLRDFTGNSMYM
jgi:hypothetical protein